MIIFAALRGLFTSRLTKRSCFSLLGIVGLIGPGFGLAHATTLTDLGYPNGLTLSGQSPSQTIYFPLPAASNGATLNLRYAPSAALDPHSSVTIAVNGVPIDTIVDSAASGVVPVAIPARFTRNQFLQISFTATQLSSVDRECYDNNNPSIWTQIDPATTLSPNTVGPQGVGAVWRGLGVPLTIALPTNPTTGDIQTALILSTSLVERGIAPFFNDTPASAQININPSASGLSVKQIDAEHLQITVPNAGAARALVAADPVLRNMLTSGATGVLFANTPPVTDTVTLGALGMPPASLEVGEDAILHLALPFSQLPAGKHVKELILYGRGAALPLDETEVVTLEIGGNVIWSRAFRGAPVLNGEHITLPSRLMESGAQINLHLVRLGSKQACQYFAALPFTLQDDSVLVLADSSPSPRTFAGFTVAGDGPVPILTDLPASSLPPALPLLAELLGSAGASPLAVTVSGVDHTPDEPFILVSHNAGKIVSIAPIPVPTATVSLSLPNQDGLLNLPETNETASILQLVSSGNMAKRVPGLWLSPGPASSLAQAALPGDGNVAFYDGSATPASFNTLLHDAVFVAPKKDVLNVILSHWNAELFGIFWIFLTVLFVIIFVRRRKSQK
jgi:Bacterial cellulose synthase subunit